MSFCFFFSSRRRHTRYISVTGVQTCALPISPADVTLIDPEREWVFDAAQSRSKGRNTPFDGWKMHGKAVLTMIDGKIRYNDPQFPVNL